MVRVCQICKKTTDKDPEVSFHRFPTDPERRNLWLSILGFPQGKILPKYPEVCSDHFNPKDIYIKNRCRYLKSDTLPELRNSVFADSSSDSSDSIIFDTPSRKLVEAEGVSFDERITPLADSSPSIKSEHFENTVNEFDEYIAGPSRVVNNTVEKVSFQENYVEPMEFVNVDFAPANVSKRATESVKVEFTPENVPKRPVDDTLESGTSQENVPKRPVLVKIGTIADLPKFLLPNQKLIYLPNTSKENTLELPVEEETLTDSSVDSVEQLECIQEPDLLKQEETTHGNLTLASTKRFFGDVTLDDFATEEGKRNFKKAQARITDGKKQIRTFQKANKKLTLKLEKMNRMLNAISKVHDVTEAKQIVTGKKDDDVSSSDSGSSSGDEAQAKDSLLKESDPIPYEDEETLIDSFNVANQVQITFLAGDDSAQESSLKRRLKTLGHKEVLKSKKIRQLNNAIFMKNDIIQELKNEIEKLKNNIS